MPHGAPDWYKYRRDSATFPIDDLAELAARLGSIHTFDRRGDVIWYDDFSGEHPGWDKTHLGTGASVAFSPAYSLHGGYSMKLTSGTDSSLGTYIQRWLSYPVLSKIGLEVAFAFSTRIYQLTWDLALFDGTYRHYISIRYDKPTRKLQYIDKDGNYQDLATSLDLYWKIAHFHILKLVVDFTNDTYSYLILDNTTYPLANTPLCKTGFSYQPHLWIAISATSQDTYNAVTYIDHVIVTQDEP